MKNARPQTTETSAADTCDYTPIIILADSLQARLMAGEVVAATDFPAADRPLFWAAIARVRDDLPYVRPTCRTIAEQHVDGVRIRQNMFRICRRQRGVIDSTLAGLIALAAICAALLAGGLPL